MVTVSWEAWSNTFLTKLKCFYQPLEKQLNNAWLRTFLILSKSMKHIALTLKHIALIWNFSLAENLASVCLQDRATKWHYYYVKPQYAQPSQYGLRNHLTTWSKQLIVAEPNKMDNCGTFPTSPTLEQGLSIKQYFTTLIFTFDDKN